MYTDTDTDEMMGRLKRIGREEEMGWDEDGEVVRRDRWEMLYLSVLLADSLIPL